ncbi:O-methyltransferase-domain-containing protein [Phyllosticta citricarpa]
MSSELDMLVDGLVAAKSQLGTASGEQHDVQRKTVIDLAGQIISEAQQPLEWMFDYNFQAGEMGALRTLMEWKAFGIIPDDRSISSSDLAAKLNSDEGLVRRLCWMLALCGLLRLVGDDAVARTKHSQVANPLAAFFRLSYDVLGRSAPDWPTYFEKYGRNTLQSAMQDHDVRLPVRGMFPFEWIAQNAHLVAADAPLVVDVGGGRGQALQEIMEEYPQIPAKRLVLQDLPPVLEDGKALDNEALKDIQRVPIDFFAEQLVKGSLTHLLRRIMHDWNNADCVKILSRIKAVMSPESRIVVMDQALQNPPHPIGTTSDMIMVCCGCKEWSVQEWHVLMKKADLQLVKIWQYPHSSAAVVECKLKA